MAYPVDMRFTVHRITVEEKSGKVKEIDWDIQYMDNGRDLRDFKLPSSPYWVKSGIEIGYNTYPRARVWWQWNDRKEKKPTISAFHGSVHYTTDDEYNTILSNLKRGLCQIPADGIERLLVKIKKGIEFPISGVLYCSRLDVGCIMIEALPDAARNKALTEGRSLSESTLHKIWQENGAGANFNSNPDGYVSSLPFTTKKDLVKTLLEIRKGDFQLGRFICPHCGKKNIKSKSGYTLHVKRCSQKDHSARKTTTTKKKAAPRPRKTFKIPTE